MIKRYFYGDSIEGFLSMPESQIIGELTTAHTSLHSSLQGMQADAWREEIELLKNVLLSYIDRGHIYFEYSIPRMGRRIDVVLLIDGVVLLLEFKAFNALSRLIVMMPVAPFTSYKMNSMVISPLPH